MILFAPVFKTFQCKVLQDNMLLIYDQLINQITEIEDQYLKSIITYLLSSNGLQS